MRLSVMLATMRMFLVLLVNISLASCTIQAYDDELTSIFLRFYNGDAIDQFSDAPLNEVRNLIAQMDRHKPTVLYIHGYTGSINSRDTTAVVTAYLQRKDHNVLATDWRRLAGKNYPSVVNSAKLVGRALALALDEMVDQGLPADKVHVVGHSMGAQVAGHLGRETSFELGRITGLDPAGPLFNFLETHLTKNDAKFVDTIHTDSGFYGIGRASGTVSFYPNAGRRVQPGCPISFEFGSPEDYCSHHRSWIYYAESLKNEESFIGSNCDTYRTFSRGDCNGNAKIPMGYATPTDLQGVFYLRTKNETPFGMGMEGSRAATASKSTIQEMTDSHL